MQQRARAALALDYVYFVRRVGNHVAGVARVNDPRTVEEYRKDTAWAEVSRGEYLQARSVLEMC